RNEGGDAPLLRGVPVRAVLFFFQADDGIRDKLVTGVHTCALPIFSRASFRCGRTMLRAIPLPTSSIASTGPRRSFSRPITPIPRSEERRVGKECRTQWSPYHEKKKKRQTVHVVPRIRTGTRIRLGQ